MRPTQFPVSTTRLWSNEMNDLVSHTLGWHLSGVEVELAGVEDSSITQWNVDMAAIAASGAVPIVEIELDPVPNGRSVGAKKAGATRKRNAKAAEEKKDEDEDDEEEKPKKAKTTKKAIDKSSASTSTSTTPQLPVSRRSLRSNANSLSGADSTTSSGSGKSNGNGSSSTTTTKSSRSSLDSVNEVSETSDGSDSSASSHEAANSNMVVESCTMMGPGASTDALLEKDGHC
ncbi:uncharacterized protein MYCGRDRAFT_89720 [Zymoseptoria tritici IPO323]|uniref:Uncharacterized protein n=1 Tax=Zymoseptoria tritici (strain CBS 115943 / IPO323) TaxID=336722 RepID=F9X1A4_ZYMTI|nr:uncharacterized protein MYCGRDRAFT_89720 [Zymoseptoria tritici IPO323]EGP91459.1 hypothetical protein MYCGRDRAFT_89720 [Zymoseptoria tritici IPO323]